MTVPEDALYEITSMLLFAWLPLDRALPDRTTIMDFRHLFELHQLARQLFMQPQLQSRVLQDGNER